MNHLDHYDRAIINFLGNRGQGNTNEVADGTRMSWATADQHLKKLHQMKYIVAAKKGNSTVWRIWGHTKQLLKCPTGKFICFSVNTPLMFAAILAITAVVANRNNFDFNNQDN